MASTCKIVVQYDDASFGHLNVTFFPTPYGIQIQRLRILIALIRAAQVRATDDPGSTGKTGPLGLVTKVVPRLDLEIEACKLRNIYFNDVPQRTFEIISEDFCPTIVENV